VDVIALSDIHGRTGMGKDLAAAIAGADLIVIAGDITNFGGKEEAKAIIRGIQDLNKRILAIPGNCDHNDVKGFLASEDIDLHGRAREIEGVLFFGVGGSGRTPFGTPQEYSDLDFGEVLKTFHKTEDIGCYVLVSHDPPTKTRVDRTAFGIHAGNKKIREFIESFQPALCICGHIHEARGEDLIGNTRIVNPGPFPKYYAQITIGGTVSCRLLASEH
jgi:Icc-related predicted phosphoesterase